MKLAYAPLDTVIELNNGMISTLVIENQNFLRSILRDIYSSIEGIKTNICVSVSDKPVDTAKYVEIITEYINFDINKKTLITKLCSSIEHIAVDEEHYLKTQELMAAIERSIESWAFSLPCDIITTKLTISNIIKSVGIELRDEYGHTSGDLEKLVDYMELVREFDRDKLFITVNLRSFFDDQAVDMFMRTCIDHEYRVLMLESISYPKLKHEQRTVIDRDLCEF